ncbi:hypothetical protein [Ferrovibrio sp.]|uniref:hypothetical protein n=1 Tax=Ferrovibrio sp. TaxID=1917215 RepID=UPI003D27B281
MNPNQQTPQHNPSGQQGQSGKPNQHSQQTPPKQGQPGQAQPGQQKQPQHNQQPGSGNPRQR